MKHIYLFTQAMAVTLLLAFSATAQNILHDNGPLITHTGTSPGGNHSSMLQITTLNMAILGFNASSTVPYAIADDFEIPEGKAWLIDDVVLYAYQTGSSTTSSFTHAYVRIWDGPPGIATSNIIFGDTIVNRMVSTSFSGIYRTSQTQGFGNTDRPVMQITAEIGTILTEGSYWIEYRLNGSIASGPWVPPVTIMGQTVTGNALQLTADGYTPLLDTYNPSTGFGTDDPQGVPFRLRGIEGDMLLLDSFWSLDVLCTGDASGEISVEVSGGVTPITYSWNHGATTASLTDLEAGTYTVEITDSIGQTIELTIEVNEPDQMDWYIGQMDTVSCHGESDGGLTIEVSGGTAPYTILWDEGTNNQTGTQIANLAAGTYHATITDQQGCEMEIVVNIAQPDAIDPLDISGETQVMEGDTVTYSVEAPEGWTLEWTAGGGTILSGQGTSEVIVVWGTHGSAFISIDAFNPDGCDVITTVGITIQEVVSVYHVSDLPAFLVYPNPASDRIAVEASKPGEYTIRLYEVSGRNILERAFSGQFADLTLCSLPASTYLLAVWQGELLLYHAPLIVH